MSPRLSASPSTRPVRSLSGVFATGSRHQLDGHHRAEAPYVADPPVGRGPAVEPFAQHLPHPGSPGDDVLFLDCVQHGERRGTGYGISSVGSSQTAHLGRVENLGPAGNRGEREAAGK